MARKKHVSAFVPSEHAPVRDQLITETIETNFMPYAMSVIVSRALPEIDGFKPAHRKLLYTMYHELGLLSGPRTKSTNICGRTMLLNPHGDASIYETLVRLTKDNETLLHPFVDSKGSWGKHYSADTPPAAPRYTEAKLTKLCAEVFGGIDKDAVDFVPNYDNTTTEPKLLPTAFPNILVNPNIGVAVGMTSSICSFNLGEVCDATVQLLKNPETSTDRLLDIMPAPDFAGGGYLVYNRNDMKALYESGRGSVRLRSRYTFDKAQGCIDVLQIPYSTTIEAIMKQLSALVKEGKAKEITDLRDEIDLRGFRLTLDVRRGTDPDALMAKLFKMSPLEDRFSCNFNVLIDGEPRQLGVKDILLEWIRFRLSCVRRELSFDLKKKEDKLHLLLGLGKILLDIDKAIRIVRNTPLEKDVVPNLMAGFDIDEIQAEYVAEIKLRYLNREYIINRISEIEALQNEIDELKELIGSDLKIKGYIASQLKEIKKKYGQPRQTQILDEGDIVVFKEEEQTENYNCKFVFTKDGYFKKITLLSLRGNDEQKCKEGDEVTVLADGDNRAELLFFTDRAQVYKAKAADFDTVKAAQLGDFIPARLGFDEDEKPLTMAVIKEGMTQLQMLFAFENGKAVRVPLSAYETKANRRKLVGAYSTASPCIGAMQIEGKEAIFYLTSDGKGAVIASELVPLKENRSVGGVSVVSLKKGATLTEMTLPDEVKYPKAVKLKKIKIPATPGGIA